MQFSEYSSLVRKADKLPKGKITPVLFGLYGELGELLTIKKKKDREPAWCQTSKSMLMLIDELGDTFWYFCCLSNRLELNKYLEKEIENVRQASPQSPSKQEEILLGEIGKLAGDFLDENDLLKHKKQKLTSFLTCFFKLINFYDIKLEKIIEANEKKISSRFIKPQTSELKNFDEGFPEYERLPDKFKMEFVEKSKGEQALTWNGVFVGNPLSNNSQDEDGYKFHDVFHFSYAAILHWSPVVRALIQHKRKSDSKIDECEDGGRARVAEEGVSIWVFNIAKENNFFEYQKNLPFDVLKQIQKMVKGLEVESCSLSLWEKAILKGYEVFRQIKDNNGGIIVGNRKNRTISYKSKGA